MYRSDKKWRSYGCFHVPFDSPEHGSHSLSSLPRYDCSPMAVILPTILQDFIEFSQQNSTSSGLGSTLSFSVIPKLCGSVKNSGSYSCHNGRRGHLNIAVTWNPKPSDIYKTSSTPMTHNQEYKQIYFINLFYKYLANKGTFITKIIRIRQEVEELRVFSLCTIWWDSWPVTHFSDNQPTGRKLSISRLCMI